MLASAVADKNRMWSLTAERKRALRPAVIHRKVIGGFRSEAGATVYALYRTVEDTARERGQNLLKTLYQALTGVNAPALACFS